MLQIQPTEVGLRNLRIPPTAETVSEVSSANSDLPSTGRSALGGVQDWRGGSAAMVVNISVCGLQCYFRYRNHFCAAAERFSGEKAPLRLRATAFYHRSRSSRRSISLHRAH